MNKLVLLSAVAVMVGFLSCDSCGQSPSTNDAGIKDAAIELLPTEQTIARDNLEVTVPSSWKEEQVTRKPVVLTMMDQQTETLMVLTKESYSGSFDQFVIESLRNLRAHNVGLIGTSTTVLNDVEFVLASTTQDNIQVMQWLTVKDGFAYSLSCGGPESLVQEITMICQGIANSLNIK